MWYFTEDQLLEFLTAMVRQGRIPKHTANAQKAAVSKMLGVMSEEEKKRLDAGLDIESLYQRLVNVSKKDLTPDTMKTYRARFNTVFQGYLRWVKSPDQFSPKIRRGRPSSAKKAEEKKFFSNDESEKRIAPQEISYIPLPTRSCKFIVPIRPHEFAHLELPPKLSGREALRINEFVAACTKSLIFEEALGDEKE